MKLSEIRAARDTLDAWTEGDYLGVAELIALEVVVAGLGALLDAVAVVLGYDGELLLRRELRRAGIEADE